MLPWLPPLSSRFQIAPAAHPLASLVEERGRIVLHRRNAPDLVLSRASDLSELAGFARLLAQMVKHLPAGDLANAVGEALPWTSYLSEEGRKEFVTELPAVIQDCEDLGTFAPLETFIASWRSTAAVMADPELADRLSRPVTKPLGTRVRHRDNKKANAPATR